MTLNPLKYRFHEVDLLAFDFHRPAVGFLEDSSVRPEMGFLADASAYNEHYDRALATSTPHLTIRPLSWRARSHHYFWNHYQTIHQDRRTSAPDYWKLQMPFRCRPVGDSIRFSLNDPSINGEARVTTYLFGIGWSTSVHLRLRGEMKPSDLSDAVGEVIEQKLHLFEINGRRSTISDVFRLAGDRILDEIYEAGQVDRLVLPNYLIVSPRRFVGPVNDYSGHISNGGGMPAVDRAAMHGLILGHKVEIPAILKAENDTSDFLLTGMTGPDFALTYFDRRRTLLFMQRFSAENFERRPVRRRALNCHLQNIRNYLMMTLGLLRTYQDTKHDADRPAVKSFREAARETLVQMRHGSVYTNPFCRSFHSFYGPLQKL